MSSPSKNDNPVSFASRLMEAERMEGLSSDEDAVYRFITGIPAERKEQMTASYLGHMDINKRVQILSEVLDDDEVVVAVKPTNKKRDSTTPKTSPKAANPFKKLFSLPTAMKSKSTIVIEYDSQGNPVSALFTHPFT